MSEMSLNPFYHEDLKSCIIIIFFNISFVAHVSS